MDRLVFDSDDMDRTEEFLCQAYARLRISSTTKNVHAHVSREVMGTLSMDQVEFSCEVSYAVQPLGKICLGVIHSGRRQQRHSGMEDTFGPGDLFSLAPPHLPYAGVVHARYTLTMFDPALLTQVAATVPTRRPEPVQLLGYRPVSPAAGQHLRHTLAYLRDHVLAEPAVRDAPLIASTASQLLAASVLHAFPNNALTEATSADRHDAHPDTLHRAIAFIEANPGLDITVADIARAASVTIRAVQLAFRHHLKITPMAYLRRVRLDRAHQDLRDADPAAGTTVTAIATRWGFAHPGRFAAYYRRTYGLAPSATLRG